MHKLPLLATTATEPAVAATHREVITYHSVPCSQRFDAHKISVSGLEAADQLATITHT